MVEFTRTRAGDGWSITVYPESGLVIEATNMQNRTVYGIPVLMDTPNAHINFAEVTANDGIAWRSWHDQLMLYVHVLRSGANYVFRLIHPTPED